MEVGELIRVLEKLPQKAEVVLQKDHDGNEHSYLREVSDTVCVYYPSSKYGGMCDVYDPDWTAEEAELDSEEWELAKIDNQCVVFYM